MRLNGALISAQLWLIIATQNTNEYDEKVLAMIPEINFLSVRQKTLPTSFSSNNLTQHPHQQHDERRLLKDRNRRFQHYQQRKGETSMNKLSDDMESTVAEPLIRFPVVTFIQTYASNDTRLIPPVNSSTLQNIAFPVLPNSEEQRNKKRRLSNNTGGREDDKDDKKKDEEDNYLNDNAIDVEVEILRKMERTTVKVYRCWHLRSPYLPHLVIHVHMILISEPAQRFHMQPLVHLCLQVSLKSSTTFRN
uniref:Bm5809 n=1 Tax=Brugia malayi TaxID=6279 RepID=A0A912HBA9_BRUMA